MVVHLFEGAFLRMRIHVGYLTDTLDYLLFQLLRVKGGAIS